MNFTRKQYLDKECTHREYYSQFVTEGHKNHMKQLFGAELSIREVNDIPLKKWDIVTPPLGTGEKMKEQGDYLTLSGIVCIAKESARQMIEETCTHELKQHDKFLFRGTENECYFRLQRVQGQSANWAMTHEGYTVSPL